MQGLGDGETFQPELPVPHEDADAQQHDDAAQHEQGKILDGGGFLFGAEAFAQFLEAFLFRFQRSGQGPQRAEGAAAVVEGFPAGAVAAALLLAELFQPGTQHIGLFLGLLHGPGRLAGAVDAGLYFAGQPQRLFAFAQQSIQRGARFVRRQPEPFLGAFKGMARLLYRPFPRGQALAALFQQDERLPQAVAVSLAEGGHRLGQHLQGGRGGGDVAPAEFHVAVEAIKRIDSRLVAGIRGIQLPGLSFQVLVGEDAAIRLPDAFAIPVGAEAFQLAGQVGIRPLLFAAQAGQGQLSLPKAALAFRQGPQTGQGVQEGGIFFQGLASLPQAGGFFLLGGQGALAGFPGFLRAGQTGGAVFGERGADGGKGRQAQAAFAPFVPLLPDVEAAFHPAAFVVHHRTAFPQGGERLFFFVEAGGQLVIAG